MKPITLLVGAALLGGLFLVMRRRDEMDGFDGPFAGPAGGGRLGGKDVTDTLITVGSLPPGGILLAGDNLPMRGLAIGRLAAAEADWGIVDRVELDRYIDDERTDDVNVETANFVLVGVSPDGSIARTYTVPPQRPEEMAAALESILEFTAQKKTA